MGTYEDSKFVKARKAHKCAVVKCAREIPIGTVYLRYQVGLMSNMKVCEDCALIKRPDGRVQFTCGAVHDRLIEQGNPANFVRAQK